MSDRSGGTVTETEGSIGAALLAGLDLVRAGNDGESVAAVGIGLSRKHRPDRSRR